MEQGRPSFKNRFCILVVVPSEAEFNTAQPCTETLPSLLRKDVTKFSRHHLGFSEAARVPAQAAFTPPQCKKALPARVRRGGPAPAPVSVPAAPQLQSESCPGPRPHTTSTQDGWRRASSRDPVACESCSGFQPHYLPKSPPGHREQTGGAAWGPLGKLTPLCHLTWLPQWHLLVWF